jgi:hypothetical protein
MKQLIFLLFLFAIHSAIFSSVQLQDRDDLLTVQEQPGASSKPKKSAGDKSKSPKEPKELPEIKNSQPNTPRPPKGNK